MPFFPQLDFGTEENCGSMIIRLVNALKQYFLDYVVQDVVVGIFY